jgi:hypothetical protein
VSIIEAELLRQDAQALGQIPLDDCVERGRVDVWVCLLVEQKA